MRPEPTSRVNKWGLASVVSLILVIPAAGASATFAGGNGLASDVTGMIFMLSAILFAVLAAKRGSRWWLVVSVLAAPWALLTLLLMTIGE
jgi:hypothetical protein